MRVFNIILWGFDGKMLVLWIDCTCRKESLMRVGRT